MNSLGKSRKLSSINSPRDVAVLFSNGGARHKESELKKHPNSYMLPPKISFNKLGSGERQNEIYDETTIIL
jgi:hypothetical protein